MANTTPVYARIDTDLKNRAEAILSRLGISTTSLITMVFSQIVLRDGLPFDISIPKEPIAAGKLSKEELDEEIIKGLDSLETEQTYTPEEVKAILKSKYDL